jgi:hypothetical protein
VAGGVRRKDGADGAGVEDEEVRSLFVDEGGDEDVAAVDVDLGPAFVGRSDNGHFVGGHGKRITT